MTESFPITVDARVVEGIDANRRVAWAKYYEKERELDALRAYITEGIDMPNWPNGVWVAINRLAELDLAHYDQHVFDREAFLGAARAKRVDQHRGLIEQLIARDPNVTTEEVVTACNPAPIPKPDPLARTAEAQARLYELNDRYRKALPDRPLDCPTCTNTGLVDEQPCTCERGRFRSFIRSFRRPDLAEGA